MSEKHGKMSEEQERRELIQRIVELLKGASTREARLVLISTHGILGK